jgi:L-aspartate oxidase
LGDLEFLQFHPTAIDIGRDPMPLASESLRGAGALLVDEGGERFTDELQPRDVVARSIWDQISKGHRVFLDARALGSSFAEDFPTIYAICASAGIDPGTDLIPVRPAAHYHMGGVLTDAKGRTDVEGLWACGEVACTGLHGANRLASNSLLEAAGFGGRVAEDVKNAISNTSSSFIKATSPSPVLRKGASHPLPQCGRGEIRAAMSDDVGVIRDAVGLNRAVGMLSPLAGKSDMALVGLMIARCALRREESRGAHFRRDFPQTDPVAQRSQLKLSDLEEFT